MDYTKSHTDLHLFMRCAQWQLILSGCQLMSCIGILEVAQKMVKDGLIKGIELDESIPVKSCDICQYTKKTRKEVKKTWEEERAANIGNLIHSDVWGPAPVRTPSHKEYHSSFTDDHS